MPQSLNPTPHRLYLAVEVPPLQGLGNDGASIPGALPQADILPGRWPFPLGDQRQLGAEVERLNDRVWPFENQVNPIAHHRVNPCAIRRF